MGDEGGDKKYFFNGNDFYFLNPPRLSGKDLLDVNMKYLCRVEVFVR